LTRFFIISLNW